MNTQNLDLTNLQLLALSKVPVKPAREQITPGTHVVAPFLVRVEGAIVVGEDELYQPTADIPTLPLLAVALHCLGAQRDSFLAKIRDAVTVKITHGITMEAAIEGCFAGVTTAMQAGLQQTINEQLTVTLPSKSRAGKVRPALTVTPVTTGVAV